MKMTVFVILHYMSYDMTVECVTTIKEKCSGKIYHVIIVDNASSNKSGQRLEEKYKKDKDVTVILNESNLGFAKGNNVGYKKAKKFFQPEFIVVMNNDVLLDSCSFLQMVENDYKKYHFEVLGPDVYAIKKNEHQSPMRIEPYRVEEVEKIISDRKRWLSHYSFYYSYQKSMEALRTMKKKFVQGKQDLTNNYIKDVVYNPVLHGACLIFSSAYIQKEDNAFNPNTFLYFEEDILHYYCKIKQYRMIYDGSIKVTHLEDVSTDLAFRNDYRKRKMKYECLVDSAGVLLQMMKNKD